MRQRLFDFGKLISVATAAICAGCATVDPRPDYTIAAEWVREATGVADVYRPDEDDAVAAKLESLLAGGLVVEEAVQIALLNNARLQAALYRIGVGRAEVVQSGLLSNPMLGISMRLPEAGGLVNIEASLAQNIAEIWQIPVRRRALERALDATILEVARQASVLAAEVRTAHYDALAAERAFAALSADRALAEQLVALTETLRANGAASGVDVNLAKAASQETHLAERSARLATFEARSRLTGLLGLSVTPTDVQFADELPAPPAAGLELEALLAIASEHRLDLAAARQTLERLAATVSLEKLRVWPVIDLGLKIEREARARSSGGDFPARTLQSSLDAGRFALPAPESGRDRDVDFIIGPSLSLALPIFDQNQAQITKADLLYLQAVKQVHGLVLEVINETRLAHERAKTAWDIARYYDQELMPLRERNLELAREAYRAGRATLLSVLEAQKTLQRAHAGHARALRDSAVAWVDLERVTGRPKRTILSLLEQDAVTDEEESPERETKP